MTTNAFGKSVAVTLALAMSVAMYGCSQSGTDTTTATTAAVSSSQTTETKYLTKEDITVNETKENSADGEHAITADGETASYSDLAVKKTGNSSGDEADFYGENAAVFATNKATLDLKGILVETAGEHANAVFSYGEGTTVNVSDSVIETTGNCSGGIMTTGGATMNAENLTIHTTGNSSAAIRSDRGGGTVTVSKGSYTTDGTGSPVIYSTADITVSDAKMESTASQGVVVEGKNSVTLNNVDLTASNTTKNGDKSDYYQAVMVYQSMSGDADEGTSSFAMNGGKLTNKNGDIFFVNNTTTTIDLSKATIVNNDDNGIFLRAAAAGWGSEGSNGGQVTLNASEQAIDGDMVVDSVSTLNLLMSKNSTFTGAINKDGAAGDVYVELKDGATWKLTGDSYITSLTCDANSIDLNGHKLYVNGKEYSEGTASTGEKVTAKATTSSKGNGGSGSEHGTPPEKPGSGSGESSGSGHSKGSRPSKPGSKSSDSAAA